jgi:hypothetical protein
MAGGSREAADPEAPDAAAISVHRALAEKVEELIKYAVTNSDRDLELMRPWRASGFYELYGLVSMLYSAHIQAFEIVRHARSREEHLLLANKFMVTSGLYIPSRSSIWRRIQDMFGDTERTRATFGELRRDAYYLLARHGYKLDPPTLEKLIWRRLCESASKIDNALRNFTGPVQRPAAAPMLDLPEHPELWQDFGDFYPPPDPEMPRLESDEPPPLLRGYPDFPPWPRPRFPSLVAALEEYRVARVAKELEKSAPPRPPPPSEMLPLGEWLSEMDRACDGLLDLEGTAWSR